MNSIDSQIKYGILLSIFYTFLILFIDNNLVLNQNDDKKIFLEFFKNKILSLNKGKSKDIEKIEFIKFLNYTIWFIISLITYVKKKNEFFSLAFISITIITNFIYEMLYYHVDTSHRIHHIITIIAILASIITNIYKNYVIARVGNIFFIAMFSSIFSSLRKILKTSVYKNISYNLYKISYIVSKLWGIIIHYLFFFKNLDDFLILDYIKYPITAYLSIHITQLYFILKIITGYFV